MEYKPQILTLDQLHALNDSAKTAREQFVKDEVGKMSDAWEEKWREEVARQRRLSNA
jgi:hypothetical protein